MNRNKFEFCTNPNCRINAPDDYEGDRRTKLTGENVLYKCEQAGQKTHYFYAPKRFTKKWAKKVKSPMPGCGKVKIDADTVYCPNCGKPVHLDRDIVRVAVAGPTNCGKTVYLTVLNELLTWAEPKRLEFEREEETTAFLFRNGRDEETGDLVKLLPDGTQVGMVPYMQYNVRGSNNLHHLHKKKSVKKVKEESAPRRRIMNRSVDLFLYDVAGEWFSGKQRQNDDRNIKIAHLFNADLILFMIDCEQIIEDDQAIPQKQNKMGMHEYRKAIKDIIQELETKNKKNYKIAFCFLAIDILKNATVAKYKPIVESFDQGNSNYKFYDDQKVSFNHTGFLDMEDKIWSLFKDGLLKGIDCSKSEYGIFAISSLGDDGEIRDAVDSSGTGKYVIGKYIPSFDPVNCWGVSDPIMWYLSEEGYIGKH